MNEEIEIFKRRFEREKKARIEAELLLETKSRELYLTNEALKHLTSDLEKMVAARTIELKTARDLAIANSDAKSLFLANMSHEIRTPMNGVLGVIHLLEQSTLSSQQKRLINTAKSSSELLLAIINDILDVSKIEAGELKLESIAFDISDVITTTIESFTHSATDKNLKIHFDIDPNLPYLIKGDPTRTRQILSNLLSNAIKFTQAGSIHVSAKINDDSFIEIQVMDSGIGIAPEKLTQIFSPFTQADDSITRQYGGTGLGLAICAHLSKVMGKQIQVTSELNKGSTFTFWLHLDVIMQHKPHVDVTHLNKPHANSNQFHNELVMLVDDNPVNREIGSEILRNQGLIVECFEDGEKALAAITKKPYRLVLMDIQMPIMDGLSAAIAIRELGGEYLRLPIIAMTAHAQTEDIAKSIAAGMNAHLIKPIQPEKIFSELSRWLQIVSKINEAKAGTPDSTINLTDHDFPLIEGVDFKESLMRVNNNKNLLKKVLVTFSQTHNEDDKKLNNLYEQQDYAGLQALAHKLKGSGATIGAKALSKEASILEALCKEKNYAQCQQIIPEVNRYLRLLIEGLDGLTIESTPKATMAIAPKILFEKIQLFTDLSKRDLSRAEKVLIEILSIESNSELTNTIKNHFDHFDMDAIYPLLNNLYLKANTNQNHINQ